MLQNVLCYFSNTLWCFKCLLTVNIKNHLIINIWLNSHRLMIFNLEWKYILIIDSIHDCICMELVSKCLLCGCKLRISHSTCVCREYRCSRKTKHIIFIETLYNGCVHITKLTTVAFVKDYDYLLIECRMVFCVLLDEGRKFLNGCNNNLGLGIS